MTATKATLELLCLGHPFQLGMLYDCRNDSLIPGITLWDSSVLKAALSEKSQISSSFEVTAEDSVSSKMLQLGVEAGLSLSVLSGLVEVSGSAKYLDDRKTSNSHCRVTLKYNCKTKFQQLTMEHLATSKIQHPDIFEKKIATHVVTEILFGAEAFFIFDREVVSDENSHNIQGQMEVLIKAISRINEIKGSAALNINDQEKKETEKFQCKFYGDLILQTNPSSFQDAVKVYKELPLHFFEKGGSTVPKKVWLYPLSSLNSKCTLITYAIFPVYLLKVMKFLTNKKIMERLKENGITIETPSYTMEIAEKLREASTEELVEKEDTSDVTQYQYFLLLEKVERIQEDRLRIEQDWLRDRAYYIVQIAITKATERVTRYEFETSYEEKLNTIQRQIFEDVVELLKADTERTERIHQRRRSERGLDPEMKGKVSTDVSTKKIKTMLEASLEKPIPRTSYDHDNIISGLDSGYTTQGSSFSSRVMHYIPQ